MSATVDQIKTALVDQLCDNDSGLAECMPAEITGVRVDKNFADGRIELDLADGSKFEILIRRRK